MPTYEYECLGCGHSFELFQSITAPVKRKCPKCGQKKLDRLIGTGAGIIFKGGGFYETDYRSDSYKKAAESEKKAVEGKSDSKPEKKDAKKSDPAPKAKGKDTTSSGSKAMPKDG